MTLFGIMEFAEAIAASAGVAAVIVAAVVRAVVGQAAVVAHGADHGAVVVPSMDDVVVVAWACASAAGSFRLLGAALGQDGAGAGRQLAAWVALAQAGLVDAWHVVEDVGVAVAAAHADGGPQAWAWVAPVAAAGGPSGLVADDAAAAPADGRDGGQAAAAGRCQRASALPDADDVAMNGATGERASACWAAGARCAPTFGRP